MAKATISRSGDRDSASACAVVPARSRYFVCWFVPLRTLTSLMEDVDKKYVTWGVCHYWDVRNWRFVMLSEAKHLYEIVVLCGEMLHFVQHDMASQCRSNPSASRLLLQVIRRGI